MLLAAKGLANAYYDNKICEKKTEPISSEVRLKKQ